MESCELCGKSVETLQLAKISGAEIRVCSACEQHGTVVETDTKTENTSTKYSTSDTSPGNSGTPSSGESRETPSLADRTQSLRLDYGDSIQSARENSNRTIAELADEMNVKSSLLRRIENEEMQPSESVQNQIETALDIDLTMDEPRVEQDGDETGETGVRFGDMVERN